MSDWRKRGRGVADLFAGLRNNHMEKRIKKLEANSQHLSKFAQFDEI